MGFIHVNKKDEKIQNLIKVEGIDGFKLYGKTKFRNKRYGTLRQDRNRNQKDAKKYFRTYNQMGDPKTQT